MTTPHLIYCDGAGDGGIDIAYLERGENGDGDSLKGDTWYLVQSKYGAASQGKLLEEAQKVLDTLDRQRARLSSLSESLLARLVTFRAQASERDRIILVFATEKALNDSQKRAIESIKAMGSKQLGALFDVEAVSIETIYQSLVERANASAVRVTIKAQFTPSGNDLLVGPISLTRLYDFLKEYRAKTGDLDRLYEKNVRRFLGSRSRVNKAMKHTLEQRPDQFGLYNNGITIVVADFQQNGHEATLHDPSIVNGCQTTRTIWEVCHPRLEAGGTGHNAAHDAWRKKVDQGVLVAKIVKVRAGDEEALEKITRYTNSQNAMREKNFCSAHPGL